MNNRSYRWYSSEEDTLEELNGPHNTNYIEITDNFQDPLNIYFKKKPSLHSNRIAYALLRTHPNYSNAPRLDTLKKLRNISKEKKLLIIDLDYLYSHHPENKFREILNVLDILLTSARHFDRSIFITSRKTYPSWAKCTLYIEPILRYQDNIKTLVFTPFSLGRSSAEVINLPIDIYNWNEVSP